MPYTFKQTSTLSGILVAAGIVAIARPGVTV
jgi:hypothetical protein